MESICGGGFLMLALLGFLALGLALAVGGLIFLLVKLGVIIDIAARPDTRGESDHYTLDASEVPDDSE